MKKILIPTDFSKISKNATRYILQMYSESEKEQKPSFTLYHSFHIPNVPSGGIGLAMSTSDSMEKSKNILEKELDYWRKEYPDFAIDSQFEMGSVESKIQDLTAETDIDLIVVGSLDVSGIDRWLLKTSAIDIAKNAEVPVMVIPEEIQYKPIDKAIFAADFTKLSILPSLRPIKHLLRTMKPKLTMLQIQESSSEEKKENNAIKNFLDQYFAQIQLKHDELKADHVAENLESYFERNNADLMILFDRDRNLFEQLFHTDLTKKMIWQGSIPLLVLHEEDFSREPDILNYLNDQIVNQLESWQESILEIKDNLKKGQTELEDKWKTKVTDMVENMKDMEETIEEIKPLDEEKWENLYKDLHSKMKKVQNKITELI